jgi:hypothetical protein
LVLVLVMEEEEEQQQQQQSTARRKMALGVAEGVVVVAVAGTVQVVYKMAAVADRLLVAVTFNAIGAARAAARGVVYLLVEGFMADAGEGRDQDREGRDQGQGQVGWVGQSSVPRWHPGMLGQETGHAQDAVRTTLRSGCSALNVNANGLKAGHPVEEEEEEEEEAVAGEVCHRGVVAAVAVALTGEMVALTGEMVAFMIGMVATGSVPAPVRETGKTVIGIIEVAAGAIGGAAVGTTEMEGAGTAIDGIGMVAAGAGIGTGAETGSGLEGGENRAMQAARTGYHTVSYDYNRQQQRNNKNNFTKNQEYQFEI